MTLLLLFLLLITPAAASTDPAVIYYCEELIVEAERAVADGIINEQEAEDLIQGCQRVEDWSA